MDTAAFLKQEKEKIDRHLAGIVSRATGLGHASESLLQAMEYSLKAGGKRLRPILAVQCYRACGGAGEAAYGGACALELIHTYTLIHDDLPAMDDDDFRRGLPTCHRKFGVRRAMLAGVGLFLAALEELARAAQSLGLSAAETGAALSDVASAVGGGGVVGGQVLDLESERKAVSPETLRYIHSHKTGALIRVSCTLGGRLARAQKPWIEALAAYGEGIGLAFQIVDDLLDVEGSTVELGKEAGVDQARGKATFPRLFGVRESRRMAGEAVEKAKAGLREGGLGDCAALEALADFILARKS